MEAEELYHHGIPKQKWGVRRYQNKDGSLTEAGRKRQRILARKTYNTARKNFKLSKKRYKITKRRLKDAKMSGDSQTIKQIKNDYRRDKKQYKVSARNYRISKRQYRTIKKVDRVIDRNNKASKQEKIDNDLYYSDTYSNSLQHYGVPKQKWGVRRYQFKDGSLTEEGRRHYGYTKNVGKNLGIRIKKKINSFKDASKTKLENIKNTNSENYKKENKRLVEKGSPKEIKKNINRFSTEELEQINNRFEAQQKTIDYVNKLASNDKAQRTPAKPSLMKRTLTNLDNALKYTSGLTGNAGKTLDTVRKIYNVYAVYDNTFNNKQRKTRKIWVDPNVKPKKKDDD